ncbi:MAG: type IA DNA topoisomerase [Lachnospiraceae bacterium]|nr:type IA DNA topoisomerase [Lachnospiraceae bacterium]
MGKDLFIAEKPSVAKEFAKVLGVNGNAGNGYLESDTYIVTWCVGHLVTMSYPDAYDPALKKWSLQTLPFLPEHFLYELIPDVKKQFRIVSGLLNRKDVSRIYVCTDSGREGEYIYRLVDQMAGVSGEKEKKRVWIDSQTEEEIRRGIAEAKPLSEYDNLSASAYLRAKEDYLMGINFSRVLSLKYGRTVMDYLGNGKWSAISVGRVMTCVLGMVVRREREIRSFVKTPFYRVLADFSYAGQTFKGEWRVTEQSKYFQSPVLYKDNGFKERKDAMSLCESLDFSEAEVETAGELAAGNRDGKKENDMMSNTAGIVGESAIVPEDSTTLRTAAVTKVEKKKEKKNPPLLFNLAELQNTSSKLFKISPDETLKIVQELYEKKLVTYPRTDARVLSTAVCKEIHKNLAGLRGYPVVSEIADHILQVKGYQGLSKTRYVNDKQITDHYAIIPTGQGLGALRSVSQTAARVYEVIVRRFLCIFYPPAEYLKLSITACRKSETFFANFKVMTSPGYLAIANASFSNKKTYGTGTSKEEDNRDDGMEASISQSVLSVLQGLKKGMEIDMKSLWIKEGETSPPKRYNSGSMILAMENAGQLIEDEDLRSQIKGSGIGTSATRAEILSKLVKIKYLKLNKKTQLITPELLGEMVYDVVNISIRSLLNPELTASWELGLTQVADGIITSDEYMEKLNGFVIRRVDGVKQTNYQSMLRQMFDQAAAYYS